MACFYVLAFVRVLGLTRTNRILGPIRITLAKMLGNVLHFFAIFGLVMFAFGIGLSELYWHYDTVEAQKALCAVAFNSTSTTSKMVPFTNIWSSLWSLFWALFGYLDPNHIFSRESGTFITVIGIILVAMFHVSVILILWNMLIAMMTKSYEVTSENEEIEWRFYRVEIWVSFIRRDFTSPPPMNLLPNFYYFYKLLKHLFKKCKKEENFVEADGNFETRIASNNINDLENVKTERGIKTNRLVWRYKLQKLVGHHSRVQQ